MRPNKTKLNRQEIEMLELIASGLTTRHIAQRMKYSVATIETMRVRILSFCKVKNSPHLVAWGFRNGLLKIESPQQTVAV